MDTLALTMHLTKDLHEALVAELAEVGFEAFTEEGDELKAYGPVGIWGKDIEAGLTEWFATRRVDARIDVQTLPLENWNAKWEASIQPLNVGPFVIAPTWAVLGPEHADKPVLLIDPKMSFGTGHHESTRIALLLLEGAVQDRDRILDAGTGTGVLAIAALKLGAANVLGFDIDPLGAESAVENASLNRVEGQFEVREGTIDMVEEADFDVVVANMIRSRLEPIVPRLSEKLSSGGRLILAGLLRSEKATMTVSMGWLSAGIVSTR